MVKHSQKVTPLFNAIEINTKKLHPEIKDIESEKRNSLCLCRTVSPVLGFARILGLFPLSWKHENNKCTFGRSAFWMSYSLVVICFQLFILFECVDYQNMVKNRCLMSLLDNITNAIYGHYIVVLLLTNFFRAPRWIRAFNNFVLVLRENLFCHEAMKTAMTIQYTNIVIFIAIVLIHGLVLLWLHLSDIYITHFNIFDLMHRISQNFPLIFYLLFFNIISALTGTLACFEQMTINVLGYIPVHPMKGIDETNNQRDYIGMFYYKLCKGKHTSPSKYATLSSPELVEHLRILHEDICLSIHEFNECMNPTFLIHTVVELADLVIHFYAVIAYLVYSFTNEVAGAIHVLNFYFVIIHTFGVFFFLKNAQHLKNMVSMYWKYLKNNLSRKRVARIYITIYFTAATTYLETAIAIVTGFCLFYNLLLSKEKKRKRV